MIVVDRMCFCVWVVWGGERYCYIKILFIVFYFRRKQYEVCCVRIGIGIGGNYQKYVVLV